MFFIAVDAISILSMFCQFEDIQRSLKLIPISRKALAGNSTFIFMVLFCTLLMIGFFCYMALCLPYLYSVGSQREIQTTPFDSVEWDTTINSLWIYQIIGTVWVIGFILGVIRFSVSATIAQWYFWSDGNPENAPSFFNSFGLAIRYHPGSFAFGSLALTLISIFRFIFMFMWN